MPNLRGRKERREEKERKVQAESDEELDFRTVDEAEDEYGGATGRESEPEQIEQGGSKAKKSRKTRT